MVQLLSIGKMMGPRSGKRKFISKIQNPRGKDGTVGVIGSGGALPTNMAVEQAMSGVATSFLGTGTAPNGKPCFYIGLNGTLSGANSLIIRLEGATYAAAAAGQAWGLDFDSYLSGGAAAGLASVKAQIRDSATIVVAESAENGLSGTPTRLLGKGVVYGSATSIYPRLVVNSLNNGATVNAVLCICAPKLVQIAALESAEKIMGAAWTTPAGWSESGGVLTATSPATFATYPVMGLNDQVVRVSITILSRSAGSVRSISYGASKFGQQAPANSVGTFTQYVPVTAVGGSNPNTLGIQSPSADFIGTLGQISLKIITAGYMPVSPILPPLGVPGDSVGYI